MEEGGGSFTVLLFRFDVVTAFAFVQMGGCSIINGPTVMVVWFVAVVVVVVRFLWLFEAPGCICDCHGRAAAP